MPPPLPRTRAAVPADLAKHLDLTADYLQVPRYVMLSMLCAWARSGVPNAIIYNLVRWARRGGLIGGPDPESYVDVCMTDTTHATLSQVYKAAMGDAAKKDELRGGKSYRVEGRLLRGVILTGIWKGWKLCHPQLVAPLPQPRKPKRKVQLGPRHRREEPPLCVPAGEVPAGEGIQP